MKICIVSPHLDDALLSCGIKIQHELKKGNEVFVLNIFSSGDNSDNRKVEDYNAFSEFKIRQFYLDELDAPNRNSKYSEITQLVFGEFDQQDLQTIERIKSSISSYCILKKIDRIYFPLAAGNHVDHRITFEACKNLLGVELCLYEERPYVLWDGIIEKRIQELFREDGYKFCNKKMAESIESYYFLKYFVPEGEIRKNCLPKYLNEKKHLKSFRLRKIETVLGTNPEIRNLYSGLEKYVSQMINIFPTLDIFIRENLEYGNRILKSRLYFERYWAI